MTSPAMVMNETLLTCSAPPANAPGEAQLYVAVQDVVSSVSTRSISFSYVADAVINTVVPGLVDTKGGTVLSLLGTLIPLGRRFECCFQARNEATICVSARRDTPSRIQCKTPPLPLGTWNVSVRLDGSTISSSLTTPQLQTHEPIQVLDVQPASGSRRGNTTLVISGRNFLFTPTVACCFNSTLVPATFVNSTQLQCVTPPYALGDVLLRVSNNGRDCSNYAAAAVWFSFREPPVVRQIVPSVVSQLGGSKLLIYGESFVANVSLAIIGSVVAPRCQAENASVLRCESPALTMTTGRLLVRVTNNGQDFSDSAVFLDVVLAEQVLQVHPAKHVALGGRNGSDSGIVVTLTTQNARDVGTLRCFAGDVEMAATFESPTRVYCRLPSQLRPGTYLIQISNDGVVRSQSSAALSLVAPPSVVDLQPRSGFSSGGTVVTISGIRLDAITHCRFSRLATVPAVPSSLGGDTIRCVAPASATVGVVVVELMIDDAVVPYQYLNFTYLPVIDRTERELRVVDDGSLLALDQDHESVGGVPRLRDMQPRSAPTRGGTPIIVTGEGFRNAMELACRFGSQMTVRAHYQSPSRIVCPTPRLAPGLYPIQVANDGKAFTNAPFHVEVFTDAYIESISPTSGPRTGGTAVTLRGAHFRRGSDSLSATRCRFGEQRETPVIKFVSSSEIVCLTPPQGDASTLVPVVVTNNNATFTSNPVFFLYTSAADIVSVTPLFGSVAGGTELLIRGYNLEIPDERAVVCRIGQKRVPAEPLSRSLVRCVTPAVEQPARVSVQLSTNGQDFTTAQAFFEYIAEPQIWSLSPPLGPSLMANTVVTVYGSGFLNTVELNCVFDDALVPATWQSSSEIRCAAPRSRPGAMTVRVSNNGIDRSRDAASYRFVRDLSIARITPTRGPKQGGTPVFVQGRNFVNHTLLACRFGEEVVKATLLSSSLVVCVAPRQLVDLRVTKGSVAVEVTVNRQDYTTSGLQFTYEQRCPVTQFCTNGNIMACPNGTICDDHSATGNFSLCRPGTFQPRQAQAACLPCPVGFYCPDFGMSKPLVCPAGKVCDTHGLRTPQTDCPSGHYCRQGTKTADIKDFMTNPEYVVEKETQLVRFADTRRSWAFVPRISPAIGSRRIEHPPNETSCALRLCDEVNPLLLLAERPYACPIGTYCRRGVAVQQPLARNFSTPQRCFPGFFCPRGSSTPEGQGPCPTGHYCPNDVDAVVCPAGQYCPGVGNLKPRDCVPGTFNPVPKQSNCTLCPSGYVCPQWGMKSPLLCPAGFVCISTGLSAPAILCPPGYICDAGTRTLDPSDVIPFRPRPCPKGTFCLGGVAHNRTTEWRANQPEGRVAPQLCTEGTYCGEGTRTESGTGVCFSGHYCPPGSSYPIQAPVGSFSGSKGSVASTLCFPGTYTPLKGTVKCEVCPAGHSCPGYGTYVPSICPRGTYRSLADSITCRSCPEGSWSPHTGLPDISFCEMCPAGRVCGSSGMSSLASSLPCAAGFVCGEGTNRRGQFDHLCPSGHYCRSATTIDAQYDRVCEPGYVCVRGTKEAEKNRNKCPDGRFCPLGTGNMTSIYTQCPSSTWTRAGQDELYDCVIRDVPVCDKRPTKQYYPQLTYSWQQRSISFDSTNEGDRTGEVEVVSVVYPVNESASVPFWKNDTLDTIRVCPTLASASGGMLMTVIGRNFLDTGRLVCRFQLRGSTTHAIVTPAFFVSSTRVRCRTPPYSGDDATADDLAVDVDVSVSNYGLYFSSTVGRFQYLSKKTFDKTVNLRDQRAVCLVPNDAEEGFRPEDKAWFPLRGLSSAKLSFDFRHIPAELVYDEHYKIAIFVKNSTCEYQTCDDRGVIKPSGPEIETWPCRLPIALPKWFMSTDVDKHDILNLTLLALEDVIFKVEVHITYGLYAAVAPFFVNSTIVQIKTPVRSNVTQGLDHPDMRPLSRAMSYEEELVARDYSFLVVYQSGDGDTTSPPLNLPPKYRELERGRVLVSHNVSVDSKQIPLITDAFDEVKPSSAYWLMPYGSAALTHEMAEKYRETFHELYLDPTDLSGTQYLFKFEKLLLSYLPFFSNCMGYDSYIPLFDLFESESCGLPELTSEQGEFGRNWWRRKFPPLPNQDDIRHVGPLNVAQEPVADRCMMDLKCYYEEDLPNADVTPRWFEQATGTALFSLLREPTTLANYFRGGAFYDELYDSIGSDYFIPVNVNSDASSKLEGDCSNLCFPRKVTLDISYYQITDRLKRIIKVDLVFENYDRDSNNTAYTLSVDLHPLNYYGLIIQFAFERQVYIVLFIVLGCAMTVVAFVFWLTVRLTTLLESPPRMRFWSMFSLIGPPPTVGIVMGIAPVIAVVMCFYVVLNGDKYFKVSKATGYWFIDNIVKHYTDDKINPEDVGTTRKGRVGLCFLTIAMYLVVLGSKIFLPKSIAISEKIMREKNDQDAMERNVWWPTQWKRANLIFTSILLAFFLTLLLEFSFWSSFGDYMFYILVGTEVLNMQVEGWIEGQLKEALLMAPLMSALGLVGGMMGFGATDFGDFVMGNTLDFGMSLLLRVYVDTVIEAVIEFISEILKFIYTQLHGVVKVFVVFFRSMTRSTRGVEGGEEEGDAEAKKKEEENEKKEEDEDVETVEPIIEFYLGCSMDRLGLFFQPVIISIMMVFRQEVMLPIIYNIREKDMEIYLWYSLIILFFQLVTEVFVLNVVELFHGWKLYDYLVYCRYRFLQREHRWKGMEPNLDECIDENLRTMDQMCFSSQFFMMCTIHITGIVAFVIAIEIMARASYNLFGDPAAPLLVAFVVALAMFTHHSVFWLAVKLEVWKIKHENTAWLAPPDEDDEFGVPRWDELEKIKGASHEAYLMNQRITSETFRYKFLNYNRSWIVEQLPSILTPRTLRRARPYLLAQFSKILDSLNPQISDDDDADEDGRPKFGPVTLSASSRTIIRWWLARARRIQRLKEAVQPIIQGARKSECEMCLSRRQLQVELAIPIEVLGDKFESQSLAEEFDVAGWKEFFTKHEKFKTVCLNCLAQLREVQARQGGRSFGGGAGGSGGFGGPQGDWGPVQLNAASYALMQKWYRKAQDRVFGKHGKRRNMVDVSDDEEDIMARHFEWTKRPVVLNAASTALARKWIMAARQSLQESGRTQLRLPDNLTAVPLSVRGGTTTPAPRPAVKMGAAGGSAATTSKMRRK
ncbi:hypothetical protein PINS_up001619 [Pythium insidiosum]|nr:hypothetical protein PINS_up001619 [Pythium insidiosum]